MGRKPGVTDFSGHNYNAPKRVSRVGARSFRCADCGKLAYLTDQVLTRATRPHCTGCGGALIESVSSEKRTLGNKRERKAKTKAMDGAIEGVRTSVACWSCGTRFTCSRGLAMHLAKESGCAYECRADKKVVTLDLGGGVTFLVYAGTAHVESNRETKYKAFSLWACVVPTVGTKSEVRELQKFPFRRDVEEFVTEVNGEAAG